MADHPGDPQVAALLKHFAPFAPGIAGSIISMAIGENLTFRGRVLAGVVSLACVAFVAPALSVAAELFWPGDGLPVAVLNLIGFVTGVFGFIVTAGTAQALAKYAADPLKLVKFRIGGLTIGEGEG